MYKSLQNFIEQSNHYFTLNTDKITTCLQEISEEEVWMRPNEASNSLGTILVHLCGNITQYIHSALGGAPDFRNRPEEFSVFGQYNKAELLAKLHETVALAQQWVATTSEENLQKERTVQGRTYTGLGLILHVVEHYSYHTGQIIFWTKLLKNQDLGFYKSEALNQRNAV